MMTTSDILAEPRMVELLREMQERKRSQLALGGSTWQEIMGTARHDAAEAEADQLGEAYRAQENRRS